MLLLSLPLCILNISSLFCSFNHHSDLDLVLGDLAAWTDELQVPLISTPKEEKEYLDHTSSSSSSNDEQRKEKGDEPPQWDLFTWGFGDQQRQYTRGQWTVHRNANKVWLVGGRIDEG